MIFKEIRLITNSLENIKAFYVEKLNFKLLNETDEKVSFRIGTSTLTFELSSIPNPIYHYAINIPENQFAEASKWLRQRVDTILVEGTDAVDFEHWNAHAIYFYDSVGNIGELIARHDLNNATDEPFSVESLLEISEIGLPTADVIGLKTALNDQLNITDYKSGGENFQAIGDENGLFVCVALDRIWFPTELKSQYFPVEVILEGKRNVDIEVHGYQFKIIEQT